MELLPGSRDVHEHLCVHVRARISCSPDEFEETWMIHDAIESTPNPLNKKYMIKRKQCTFGAEYAFAGQKSKRFPGPTPSLVQKVLDDVRRSAGDKYDVVHANFYPDGTAGLMPHADDEPGHEEGMAIYSYTFLSQPGNPRGFQIYEKDEQVSEYMLDHGDLFVMGGGMQRYYKHGVKKSSAKRYAELRRINMTVRAWRE